MKRNSILIVGGTGMIGYNTAIHLLNNHYQVSILSRNPQRFKKHFPAETRFFSADIETALQDPKAIIEALKGIDILIYSAGAVEVQVAPKAPAYNFFYHEIVKTCSDILKLAQSAGVKRAIIMGSYFTYLNRLWPELKMAEVHPYIHARKDQIEMVSNLRSEQFLTSICEVPYVIGSMPERKPLWTPLVKYMRSPYVPHLIAHGGTALITMKHMANAIRCIIETPQPQELYALAEKNVLWTEFCDLLRLGLSPGKYFMVPDCLVRFALSMPELNTLKGRESSLVRKKFVEVILRNNYLDLNEYFKLTGVDPATNELELVADFKEMIKSCYSP